MRSSNSREIRLIDAAVADAVSAAQWERTDLETRRPDQAPDELMLAKAVELAMSPIARDQLLSLALEHSVQHPSSARSVIDVDCCSRERSLIADRIFAMGPHPASESEGVVLAVEGRHSRRVRQDVRFDLVAECLRQDAILQEAFWDHPGIPATDDVRLTMLCSIPKLQDRAQELSSSASGWWAPFSRLFSALSKRGVQ